MSPLDWITGSFALVLVLARLRSQRFQRLGLCERCGKRSPSTTRQDFAEPIRVCASCSGALSIPHRRFGSGRYANRCALFGALVFVAAWSFMGLRVSFTSVVVCAITGAIIGGLVAWVAFPDLESS